MLRRYRSRRAPCTPGCSLCSRNRKCRTSRSARSRICSKNSSPRPGSPPSRRSPGGSHYPSTRTWCTNGRTRRHSTSLSPRHRSRRHRLSRDWGGQGRPRRRRRLRRRCHLDRRCRPLRRRLRRRCHLVRRCRQMRPRCRQMPRCCHRRACRCCHRSGCRCCHRSGCRYRGTREKPIDSQAKRNDALNRSGCRPSGSAIAAPVVLSSYEARPPVLVAGGSKDSIFDHCLSRSLINRSTARMEHTPCPMESLSVG